MGLSISWIAFQGVTKEQALERLSLRDTGEPDEANESAYSGVNLPTGWYVLFANDYSFVDLKKLVALSTDCRLIACNLEEHVMVSAAYFYENEKQIWSVEHDAQQSILHLCALGALPPTFTDVRARLLQQQKDNGGEKADVDYVIEIPLETARDVCGYRYEEWDTDSEPKFTRLEPTNPKPKKSWFGLSR
jgi:hypothetical protein